MRKRLFLLVLAVTLVSAAALTPKKLHAMCGCGVGAPHQTATYPGAGPSCTSAESAWLNQAGAEVDAYTGCPDGPCNVASHVTVSCYWDPSVGAYRESGYYTFHCNYWCP